MPRRFTSSIYSTILSVLSCSEVRSAAINMWIVGLEIRCLKGYHRVCGRNWLLNPYSATLRSKRSAAFLPVKPAILRPICKLAS